MADEIKRICTRNDYIHTIWEALWGYREQCIPERHRRNDKEWDDITSAMAWMEEDLNSDIGIPISETTKDMYEIAGMPVPDDLHPSAPQFGVGVIDYDEAVGPMKTNVKGVDQPTQPTKPPIMTVENAAAFLYMAYINDDADIDEALRTKGTNMVVFEIVLNRLSKNHPARKRGN